MRVPSESSTEAETTVDTYDYASDQSFVEAAQFILDADSLRTLSDILLNRSDSLYAVSDSYYGQGDSLQAVSDSLYNLSETLQVQSDKMFVIADSLQQLGQLRMTAMGRDVMPAGSLRQLLATNRKENQPAQPYIVQGKHLKLDKLFTAVKDRFPRTEHATYADQMLRALVEMRPPRDSAVVETLAQEDLEKVVEQMSDEERHMKGPGGVDTTATGWTLIVASFSDQERAGCTQAGV